MRRQLAQTLMRQGLHAFVLETIAPLNDSVADNCVRGDLELFEEHLYAEQVQGVLRSAIHSIQHEGKAPCVVVASLASDSRALGRVMLEAVLSVGGAICIPLGAETPGREIARAASVHYAQVVALSFSTLTHDTSTSLSELRTLLPRGIEIWASGSSLARMKKLPAGIAFLYEIAQLPAMLHKWRSTHGQ